MTETQTDSVYTLAVDILNFLHEHNYTKISNFRIEKLLGYQVNELMNKSVYEYHHAVDSRTLEKSYNQCEYQSFQHS